MVDQRRGFLATAAGHLSIVELVPDTSPRGSVLFVPPFGEEMNCSRRAAALLGRRLAESGLHWVAPDLTGTGESSGCLTRATIDDWIEDIVAAGDEVRNHGYPLLAVISIRFGALLAAAAARRLAARSLILWEPLSSGAVQVRELVQQRALSDRLRGERGARSADQLEAELQAGGIVELGGYPVSAALAAGMKALDLHALLAELACPCYWMQIASAASRCPAPDHARVQLLKTPAAPFWIQPEAPLPHEVIVATEQLLSA